MKNINYARKENNKTIDFCDKSSRKLDFFAKNERIDIGKFEKGTKLSKDNKGARINARIDAMRGEKEFDEEDTPLQEIETIDEDIVNELINREIDKIFED